MAYSLYTFQSETAGDRRLMVTILRHLGILSYLYLMRSTGARIWPTPRCCCDRRVLTKRPSSAGCWWWASLSTSCHAGEGIGEAIAPEEIHRPCVYHHAEPPPGRRDLPEITRAIFTAAAPLDERYSGGG
jgi:hypothetical protein